MVLSEKRHSLSALFRRLVWSMLLTVIGSLLLAAARLQVVRGLIGLDQNPIHGFLIDLAGLTAVIFGLLSIWAVLPEFRERLARLDSLGERDW